MPVLNILMGVTTSTVNTTFISLCHIIGSLNLYLTHGSSAFNSRCLLNEPLETVLIGTCGPSIDSHCYSLHNCCSICVMQVFLLNFINVENYEEEKFIKIFVISSFYVINGSDLGPIMRYSFSFFFSYVS